MSTNERQSIVKKALALIQKGRELVARARKAVVPAVGALGLIVGTDSPTYVNVVAILVAFGVYWVPNAKARR
jgi:mannitol-specific phosphotransferase system IIBC component